jgi:hypothetical protein
VTQLYLIVQSMSMYERDHIIFHNFSEKSDPSPQPIDFDTFISRYQISFSLSPLYALTCNAEPLKGHKPCHTLLRDRQVCHFQ